MRSCMIRLASRSTRSHRDRASPSLSAWRCRVARQSFTQSGRVAVQRRACRTRRHGPVHAQRPVAAPSRMHVKVQMRHFLMRRCADPVPQADALVQEDRRHCPPHAAQPRHQRRAGGVVQLAQVVGVPAWNRQPMAGMSRSRKASACTRLAGVRPAAMAQKMHPPLISAAAARPGRGRAPDGGRPGAGASISLLGPGAAAARGIPDWRRPRAPRPAVRRWPGSG